MAVDETACGLAFWLQIAGVGSSFDICGDVLGSNKTSHIPHSTSLSNLFETWGSTLMLR